MKKEKINYFRRLLVLQIRELHNAASKTVSDLKKGSGELVDPLDLAAVEYDRQMELSIRGRDRGALNEIRQALQRMERGIFGVCEICGKPISEKRLMAKPTSRCCVNCQQRLENLARITNRYGSPVRTVNTFVHLYD